jgi:hypothetical protein
MEPIELLPYREFSSLTLGQFLSDGRSLPHPIVLLEDWQFMGGSWLGHACGFSEFLYHHDRPHELGSLALDAETLPPSVFSAALAAIRLPVRAGMSSAFVESILGKPRRTHAFAPDRVSYEYSLGDSEAYQVSLTIKLDGGLTYVVVTRADVLALCDEDA